MNVKSLAFVISAAVAGVTATAAGAGTPALPSVQTQGQISYVTGGVGEDEAAAFKQAAVDYPLQLQFVRKASPRDEFLSEVKVTIRSPSKAVVLDTVSNGPFLLAKLPPGTYQIDATYEDMVKRQTVDIRAGRHERAVFVWTTRPTDASDAVVSDANDR